MTLHASPRLVAALCLLAVALLGVTLGATVDRMWLLPRGDSLRGLGGGRAYVAVPQGIGARWARGTYADDLARELELTAAQRAAIDAIVQGQQQRVTELTREIEPRFRAIAQETRRQIAGALTETQRAKFDALRGSYERNRRDQDPDRQDPKR